MSNELEDNLDKINGNSETKISFQFAPSIEVSELSVSSSVSFFSITVPLLIVMPEKQVRKAK